jgi:hypothetical protein
MTAKILASALLYYKTHMDGRPVPDNFVDVQEYIRTQGNRLPEGHLFITQSQFKTLSTSQVIHHAA